MISGRSPPLYDIITLIVMQGHRKASKIEKEQCSTPPNMVVIRSYYAGCKYKSTTWYSSWGKKLQIRNLQLRNLSKAFLRGYPDGSNIGSTVNCRGEGHNIIGSTVCMYVWSSHIIAEYGSTG